MQDMVNSERKPHFQLVQITKLLQTINYQSVRASDVAYVVSGFLLCASSVDAQIPLFTHGYP